jgi:aldose 1-epimerase
MDDGFPGACSVSATYTLGEDELRIDYAARSDRPTVVNLSQHVYLNLRGGGRGDVLNHLLTLAAERYTPVDGHKIPTGAVEPVRGTPLDFRAPTPIGRHIRRLPGGYDHNFVLDAPCCYAGQLHDPDSGRVLEIATDQPGLQLYSGDALDGSLRGPGGNVYRKHGGVVLEPQHFPDSVHHPDFPSTLLRPGEIFRRNITYRFTTD